MGPKRDKDSGEVVEVPSGGGAADRGGIDLLAGRGRGAAGGREAERGRFGEATALAGGRFGVDTKRSDVDVTRVHLPGAGARSAADGGAASASAVAPAGIVVQPPTADRDPMDDPPVGWLVIVEGPGKGRVVTLGNNRNFIGRDRGQRVSLDYGDDTISREQHSEVVYDPNHRRFHVGPGTGTNLTYVKVREGDPRQLGLYDPVLAPRPLEPLTYLWLGNTVLRFVPLCGADFSWEDDEDEG